MDSGYRHTISFQSSAINSTSEMMMMGDYYGMSGMNGMNSTSGMVFSGNSGMGNSSSGFAQIGKSCASDAVAGLKHDAGLAVEWSVEEQYKLEEGISKYANEPTIMRYIKIAATLRDKTVRDVALRCQWMTDNLVQSTSKQSISSISTSSVAPFSVTTNNRFLSGIFPMEALSISTRHLLEQNNQVFGQISANMSALKLQDNINLFNHAKNNLTAILNDIKYLPGPPLPVSLNEDLATSILPSTSPTMTFGSSSRMQMKQEPHY